MAGKQTDRQIWPLVVAHRGASALYPENTLEAFEGAIDAGADMVELDVRLTSDRVPIVLHDADVSLTTNGAGFVHELTLAEVKALDVSKGGSPPVRIPTLREVLETLSGRIGVDIELKNLPGEPSFDYPREMAAHAVLELLDTVGFAGPVLLSSFSWLSIERIRELDPEIPTGFITTALIDPGAALVYASSKGHAWVLPQAPAVLSVGATFVKMAHDSGLRVGTWTIDDPGVIEDLFGMGVDAVATNDPASAIPARDARRRSGKD
jgi:glycerophosphoryl diester phosphodiesterase